MSTTPAYSDHPFGSSHALFEALTTRLSSRETAAMAHGDVEELIGLDGREMLRQMFQDHLDVRAQKERRRVVLEGADGVLRTHSRARTRALNTVFGKVEVQRFAYGSRNSSSLCPMDADLNLPREQYSDGLRRRVAEESARGSFDEAVEAVVRNTATAVPKRQAEMLASVASGDFDAFYETRSLGGAEDTTDPLILTVDGKGIVMRKEHLRSETRKVAQRNPRPRSNPRAGKELSGRRRMATVASVYTVARHMRSPEDVVGEVRGGEGFEGTARPERPRARNKRVWASVEKPPEAVIKDMFAEALRRDPRVKREWVVLVDGDPTQVERIEKVATRLGVEITIVLDFIHVLQYLWEAANALCGTGTDDAERWVCERALRLLEGRVSDVAAGIRRSATLRDLRGQRRKAVDRCADYLLKYRDMIGYDECLVAGFPIATGVIEGACRHLVKDRLDITGARWSLAGAEAILRLRSLRASGDFGEYWRFHQRQRLETNHLRHYAANELRRAG